MKIFYLNEEMAFPSPKTIYLAHPLRGNVVENTRRATEICQALSLREDLVIMSPIHAFGFCDPGGDQTVPFRLCREWLRRCDMLWLFSDWRRSEGCVMERGEARENNILALQADFRGGNLFLRHATMVEESA